MWTPNISNSESLVYDLSRHAPTVSKRGAHIEVVCEDPTTLRNTLSHLRLEGHKVSLVIRMQEAVARRDLIRPQLVVLDARWMLATAELLCSTFNNKRSAESTDLLVLLDETQRGYRRHFIDLGAADCIACGDDPDEIELRIDILLARQNSKFNPPVVSDVSCSPRVTLICEFLKSRLAVSLEMSDIEKRFSSTRRKLNAQFEKEMGCTIFAWFKQQKMLYATELLKSTSMSVEDISSALGYNCVCNFSTAFRVSTGKGPRDFRKDLLAATK